jgi:hypothetical protein
MSLVGAFRFFHTAAFRHYAPYGLRRDYKACKPGKDEEKRYDHGDGISVFHILISFLVLPLLLFPSENFGRRCTKDFGETWSALIRLR